ncbi:hypothetical protein TrVFT333_011721 [Trichoderma virens FT-333]|nr:hypothetical protein TrVFT333_011721 [Trichoderma virens FT-333]
MPTKTIKNDMWNVIADECHYIKTESTAANKLVRQLDRDGLELVTETNSANSENTHSKLEPLGYITFYEPRMADTTGSAVVNEEEKAAIDIDIPDDENSDEEHEVPSGFLLGGHG